MSSFDAPLPALPPAEKIALNLGFMRLVDAAPLVVARELGFFARFGLEVDLVREVSWANIRDKVTVGALDAGQMLAPMPLLTSLGVGGLRCPLLTGLTLNLNGNAIALSTGLYAQLDCGAEPADDPLPVARALARHLAASGAYLTLATVYPFSTHTLQLRLWLAAGGIDPDAQVRLVVLPPEQMVDSLTQGLIDGFCVGEPWNSAAVQSGVGVIVASGYDVWNNAPEKVLGVTAAWHEAHPGAHLRLRLALMEAGRWLADAEHRAQAAQLLASRCYLDLPQTLLLPALLGRHRYRRNGALHVNPDFLVFHRYQAGFPWHSAAEQLARECLGLLGRPLPAVELGALAASCYRTDLYRDAARTLAWPCPQADSRSGSEQDGPQEVAPGIVVGANRRLAPDAGYLAALRASCAP
ncbi:MAG TPA: CmpA/NrtA family ABC transporter substrate-binding protein [Porticoccaceae bacterium]|nr:CmpA/NrtA family ABC transporter substrate-binding protein [Porticoccaceae bacterium]